MAIKGLLRHLRNTHHSSSVVELNSSNPRSDSTTKLMWKRQRLKLRNSAKALQTWRSGTSLLILPVHSPGVIRLNAPPSRCATPRLRGHRVDSGTIVLAGVSVTPLPRNLHTDSEIELDGSSVQRHPPSQCARVCVRPRCRTPSGRGEASVIKHRRFRIFAHATGTPLLAYIAPRERRGALGVDARLLAICFETLDGRWLGSAPVYRGTEVEELSWREVTALFDEATGQR
jgi:hypothetical protein